MTSQRGRSEGSCPIPLRSFATKAQDDKPKYTYYLILSSCHASVILNEVKDLNVFLGDPVLLHALRTLAAILNEVKDLAQYR